MSHRYESNVRDYLQRATPQEWAVMEDRERAVVELATQIREMVEQTEDQLLGQTSLNPDYLQEVGRRNQAKRTAEEIALNQVLYEAYPAEADPEDDGDEPPEEPPLRPLWADERQLPAPLGTVPWPSMLDRQLEHERKWWDTHRSWVVPRMRVRETYPPLSDVGVSVRTEDWSEVERYFTEQAPVVEFLRSLTWETWPTAKLVLERATLEMLEYADWETLFAVTRQELHRGTLQAALRQ